MAFSSNDVLTLAKAGFTAEQIAGLSLVAGKPDTVSVADPVPVVSPAVSAGPVAAPAPATAPAPAPAPTPAVSESPAVDPILAEIQKLTGLMQLQNINNSQQKQPQTPEEILAEIINPPVKKKE